MYTIAGVSMSWMIYSSFCYGVYLGILTAPFITAGQSNEISN